MADGRQDQPRREAHEEVTSEDFRRRRRARNWALLIALAVFVLLVYVVAIVRMGGG